VTRYPEPMARLIEELKKLPGVGSKSAERFAFHILRSNRRRCGGAGRGRAWPQGQPAPLLHLQQRHRRRTLHILRPARTATSAWCAWSRAHQHRRDRAN